MDKIDLRYVDLVPKFIRRDRNGYALAKAISWAVEQFCADIEKADAFLTDPNRMPEWALDEYAYNYGLKWYDKTASIEVKRQWVKDAEYMRYCIGTKEAVRHLMLSLYKYCSIDEWFEYDGKPFEFRVGISGDTSENQEIWAMQTVGVVKNLRSMLTAFAQATRENLLISQRDSFFLITYSFPGESEELQRDNEYEGSYGAIRVDAKSKEMEGYASYRIAGEDIDESSYGAIGINARSQERGFYTIHRIAGNDDDRASAGVRSVRAGDKMSVGYVDYPVCGDMNTL